MPALEGESEAAGEGLVPTESAGGPREPGPQGLGRGYNDALLKGRIFWETRQQAALAWWTSYSVLTQT